MVVNADKTAVICVSDALNYLPIAYIEADGEIIESGTSMKLLGSKFLE